MIRTPTRLLLFALAALNVCNSQAQHKNGDQIAPPVAAIDSKPARKTPDIDPHFMESSAISSKTGPQTITRNILQDSKGGFWLATWNGFIRYDGSTFTNVTNDMGLSRNRAFSLLEDHQKNIWLGTLDAGVCRFNGSTYTNFTSEDGLVDDAIISMMQDSYNNIWFGSKGVTKFDGSNFTSFTKKDGFTGSDVNSISQAPDGGIRFGTISGIGRIDAETAQYY